MTDEALYIGLVSILKNIMVATNKKKYEEFCDSYFVRTECQEESFNSI